MVPIVLLEPQKQALAQLLVDEWQEFFQGRVIPVAPRLQEPGNLLG